jgi:hypothetical protein
VIVNVIAGITAVSNKRLVVRLDSERQQAQNDRLQAQNERDKTVKELQERRRRYALETFERCRRMVFYGGDKEVPPTVTIRHCSYAGDDKIAERIKNVFDQYLRWPVNIDASNNPALERAERFKVVFDVGFTLSYGEVIRAFDEGDFLGVTVGALQADRDDERHLIVKVLPSPPA